MKTKLDRRKDLQENNLFQLTEAKLKQMILESMYSPSTLIDDALANPDVHPKIKELLSSQRDEDKRQGLTMLVTLYPDKYGDGVGIEDRLEMGRQAFDQAVEDGAGNSFSKAETDHVHLGSEKYKKEFSYQTQQSHVTLMRVKTQAHNFNKSINYSPKFPADTGFIIFKEDDMFGGDTVVMTSRRSSHGLKELEDFEAYLFKNFLTSEIEQGSSEEFSFTVFSGEEDLLE